LTAKQRNISKVFILGLMYVGMYLACMAVLGNTITSYYHGKVISPKTNTIKAEIGLDGIAGIRQ